MVNRREYVSPDGLLRFLVTTEKDGDKLPGFEGYEWHTHANLLSSIAGITEDEAVEKFVQELIGNQTIIAISRVGCAITNVRVTYDPESELLAPVPGETIELRYWNGKPWAGF